MDKTNQMLIEDLGCKFFSLTYDVDPDLHGYSNEKLLANLKRVATLDPTAILNSIITDMETNGSQTV